MSVYHARGWQYFYTYTLAGNGEYKLTVGGFIPASVMDGCCSVEEALQDGKIVGDLFIGKYCVAGKVRMFNFNREECNTEEYTIGVCSIAGKLKVIRIKNEDLHLSLMFQEEDTCEIEAGSLPPARFTTILN